MSGQSISGRFSQRARVALLLLCWVAHAILFHMPIESRFAGPGLRDKLVHVAGYFMLAVLAALAARPWSRGNEPSSAPRAAWTSWLGIALLLAGYGLLDELTQPLTGRTFSWLDWIADLTGISLGLATTAAVRRAIGAATEGKR